MFMLDVFPFITSCFEGCENLCISSWFLEVDHPIFFKLEIYFRIIICSKTSFCHMHGVVGFLLSYSAHQSDISIKSYAISDKQHLNQESGPKNGYFLNFRAHVIFLVRFWLCVLFLQEAWRSRQVLFRRRFSRQKGVAVSIYRAMRF